MNTTTKNTTNTSFMVYADIESMYSNGTCHAIARKLLFNLFCRGNNNAYDIYTGKNNGQITLDDITQEMYAFLLENCNEWYIFRSGNRYSTDSRITRLVFLNNDIERDFYRIVSNMLYREKTRHENRKLWIELGNELGKIDDISFLASHTCIDDVMTLSLYNGFLSYLITVKPKKAQLYTDFINARLQGLKIRETAKALQIKETTAFDCAKQLKALWKEYNK